MGSWFLFLLLSSQLIAHGSVVNATFDIGLRWLRGDNSLFSRFMNATATTTTETVPSTLQGIANATNTTEDPLYGGHTELVRDIPAYTVTEKIHEDSTVTTTTEAVDLRGASTESSWTEAESADWTTRGTTEETLPTDPRLVNATAVSLDQLALEISKVPDPVLHVVDNGDGYPPSFVIVSGRLGGTTTTTPVDTTTIATEPITTTAADATIAAVPSTITAPFNASTAVLDTTAAAIPNATSPYQILLDYLRPFIFGRFSATTAPPPTTVLSTAGTTPSPVTTTTFVDGRQLSPNVTAATAAVNANETEASPTEATATTTLFPAEFRATMHQREIPFITSVPGEWDFNTTVVSTALPSATPLPTTAELLTTSTPLEASVTAPTTPLPVNPDSPASTTNPTDVAVRTPVIVKAINYRRNPTRINDRQFTMPPSVQSLTETPTASFPAIFDLYGADIDPGSQTLPSDNSTSSAQTPSQRDYTPPTSAQGVVYRHFYDPSELMQTF